jgi:thiosulfate/3-mercaptopyruvate sulfurtransferase
MKLRRHRDKLGSVRLTTLIDVPSLRSWLAAGTAVLLDCRFDLHDPAAGRRAWTAAHLPGAHHADLGSDLSGPVTAASGRHPLPDPDALARFLGGLGIGADTPVIAYDQSNGSFAARAWWLLRWLGSRNVAVLDGGFEAWVAAGGSVESTDPPRRAVRFSARPDGRGSATADDVLAAVADSAAGAPGRRVVDARAAERFSGSVEPLDAVAGHVPGAVNHPFTANLGADGRFLSAPELRRRWSATLGTAAPGDAIVMCGSGVTACHDLLALEHAGLTGARLYAGSWSEWIRDPQRPVARD